MEKKIFHLFTHDDILLFLFFVKLFAFFIENLNTEENKKINRKNIYLVGWAGSSTVNFLIKIQISYIFKVFKTKILSK